MSFHQSLETDQSIETHESAPKIKRSYHHRESPIERFARRTEIAPLDPAKNIAFVAAARRYRQHWLYRDGSNYHDREFVAAQAALAAYSKNVLRMVEFVVLDELSVKMIGKDAIRDENGGRRKRTVLARLYLGLQVLTEHFSTRQPPDRISAPPAEHSIAAGAVPE